MPAQAASDRWPRARRCGSRIYARRRSDAVKKLKALPHVLRKNGDNPGSNRGQAFSGNALIEK
jgi:hypothetical protein